MGFVSLRALRTPLTLAVLSLLREGPRHPYELQTLLRERQVGTVVKLRGGSIYDAIRRLDGAGLVERADVNRQGARPERTVYRITDDGLAMLDELVREYVRAPVEEYPVFPAALAHILNLTAEDAAELLRERQRTIQETYDAIGDQLSRAASELPRVVVLEAEYAQTLRAAELTWLRGVIADIEGGQMPWLGLSGTQITTRRRS